MMRTFSSVCISCRLVCAFCIVACFVVASPFAVLFSHHTHGLRIALQFHLGITHRCYKERTVCLRISFPRGKSEQKVLDSVESKVDDQPVANKRMHTRKYTTKSRLCSDQSARRAIHVSLYDHSMIHRLPRMSSLLLLQVLLPLLWLLLLSWRARWPLV